MTTFKIVLSTWLDTTDASDALQITPTFDTGITAGNPETLCNDLLTAWEAWLAVNVRGTQIRATAYDVRGAKPNYPKFMVTRNADTAKPAPNNRELALCLSFFNENNRPRNRGRLYIPVCFTGQNANGAVADGQLTQKVADLVPIFTGLGGIDVDWGVWSTVDSQFRKATDWFVDNSWDTQRRRGKRATARVKGTTSE